MASARESDFKGSVTPTNLRATIAFGAVETPRFSTIVYTVERHVGYEPAAEHGGGEATQVDG